MKNRCVGLVLTVLLAMAGSAVEAKAITLSASPTTLNYLGSGSQSVAVNKAGKGVVHWTVTTTQPWLTATPTSGSNSGTVTVTVNAAGLTAGSYAGTVKISTVWVYVTLTVATSAPVPVPAPTPTPTPTPTPAPLPNAARGPQSSITCPSGSVLVNPTQDIAAMVAAATAPNLCLQAGVYSPLHPIYAKNNLTLTGQMGAIIDLTNVTQSYDQGGTSGISGWNLSASNVTIRNLTIRNLPNHNCIGAYGAGNTNWTVDHAEVYGCTGDSGYGVTIGGGAAGTKITNSYLHDNGCNTGQNHPLNLLVDNNELAHSTYTGCKVAVADYLAGEASNVVFTNNYVHDNAPGVQGVWYDTEGTGGVISNNTIGPMPGAADIMVEASTQTDVSTNTLTVASGSGSMGVFNSNAKNTNIHNNTINSQGGIAISEFYDGSFASFPPGHNTIAANIVKQPATGVLVAGYSCGGALTAAQCQSFWLSGGSAYTGNSYILGSISGASWYLGGGGLTWTQWQALGQDVTGSVMVQ